MELNPGEVICDKCKGMGFYPGCLGYDPNCHYECPKCLGEGKLDWIENIVGKKKPIVDLNDLDWDVPF